MRYAGIDIASETHVLAVLDEQGAVLVKPMPFGEDAEGYRKALAALAGPEPVLVAMEATGHYWKNLFAVLAAEGHRVALINPLRTHHFQKQELARTKTDAIDAAGLARFAREKRPAPSTLGSQALEELRELVRHRRRSPILPGLRPRRPEQGGQAERKTEIDEQQQAHGRGHGASSGR
jgi:transposase